LVVLEGKHGLEVAEEFRPAAGFAPPAPAYFGLRVAKAGFFELGRHGGWIVGRFRQRRVRPDGRLHFERQPVVYAIREEDQRLVLRRLAAEFLVPWIADLLRLVLLILVRRVLVEGIEEELVATDIRADERCLGAGPAIALAPGLIECGWRENGNAIGAAARKGN